MATTTATYGETNQDFNSEKSNWDITMAPVTALNYAARVTLLAALSTAVGAISLNTRVNTRMVSEFVVTGSLPPSSLQAQRELKTLFRYHDSVTGKKFSVEIAGADNTLRATTPPSDFLDTTNGAYIAFKSAFEAVAVAPGTGNSVILDSGEIVGRRG